MPERSESPAMASDPRIEAAARAMSALTCWPPDDEAEALLWREQAQEALAAADAADPLRDRDRVVPIIERALMEARAERDNVSVEAHHWMGQAARYREALERIAAKDPKFSAASHIARGALKRRTRAAASSAVARRMRMSGMGGSPF